MPGYHSSRNAWCNYRWLSSALRSESWIWWILQWWVLRQTWLGHRRSDDNLSDLSLDCRTARVKVTRNQRTHSSNRMWPSNEQAASGYTSSDDSKNLRAFA